MILDRSSTRCESGRRGEVVFYLLVAKLNALDAHRSLGGMSTTEQLVATVNQSPLKVKIRRGAKGPEAQLHPATVVDIYPTLQRVPLANARQKPPPQATGTGARASNAVGVSDPVPGTIATIPTTDQVSGSN